MGFINNKVQRRFQDSILGLFFFFGVFNFANNYGSMAGLTYTDFADGWYVPSCAELYKIYENKATIQTSLDAAGGFYIGTYSYWSSSQDASYYWDACYVYFYDGYVYSSGKDCDNYVLVLQAFNYQQFSN